MSPTFTIDQSKKLTMLVKKRPCLFLQSLSNNRHQNDRKYAWEEISNNMNVSVDACKKQWKNMRDTYIRVKRLQKTPNNKDMAKVSKTSLTYYSEVLENALSFLDDNETSHNQSTSECNLSGRGIKGKKNNYVQNDLISTSSTSPRHILKNNKRKLTTDGMSPTKKTKIFKDLDTLLNKLDRDGKENSYRDTTTNEENLINVFKPTKLFSSLPSTSKKVQQTDNFEARKNKISPIRSPIEKMKSNEDLLVSNEKNDIVNECDTRQEDFDNSDSSDEDVLSNLTLSQSTCTNSLEKKKKKKNISTEKITDKNVKLNNDLAKLLNKLDKNIEENCFSDTVTNEENSNVLKRTGLYTSPSFTSQVQQSCVSKEGKSDVCPDRILTKSINSNNNLLPDNDGKKVNISSVPNNDEEEEEPVDVFFKSMALTVKGFSFDMKMRAKKEVFNIISELEILNHNNN